ncbi:MAG: PP2C family serine/threonine-protein phosphatase [Acutalibacteraceae bacterium]
MSEKEQETEKIEPYETQPAVSGKPITDDHIKQLEVLEQSGDFDEIMEDIDNLTEAVQSENTVDLSAPSVAEIPQPTISEKPLSNDAVTEHTASLWKYLPVPETMPEPSPEYKNDTVIFPKSRVTAARVRGKKHKHEGSNCDDWYEIANFEDITFIAVSDGAGSKKYSRIGARVSCKAAVGYLLKSIGEQVIKNPDFRKSLSLPLSEPSCAAVCRMLAEMVQQAAVKGFKAVESAYYERFADKNYYQDLKRSLQINDFSATLLLTAVIPISEETKEVLVITCQVGDGMAALVNTNGEFETAIRLMGAAESGAFSGETVFLTSLPMNTMDALQKRTKIFRGVADTLLIMTDGVADDYFPNETELRRLYFDLIANGIIDNKTPIAPTGAFTIEQQRLLEKLPVPLSYPWVNDRNIKYALHDTKRICEATGLSMKDIWSDDTVLALAAAESDVTNSTENHSERLKIWLDNYVERGSFDDRTLVIVQM